MNTDEALRFLIEHQPFPDGEAELEKPFLDDVKAVVDHFMNIKDNRCIPILVNCLSYSSLMGLMPQIERLLLYEYPREVVVPALINATGSSNEGTRYTAIELSGWFKDRLAFLECYRKALAKGNSENIRWISAAQLQFIVTREDFFWLDQMIDIETNSRVKRLLMDTREAAQANVRAHKEPEA